MRKSTMLAAVSALAAVLVIAGCGGRDAKDKPAQAETAPAPAVTADARDSAVTDMAAMPDTALNVDMVFVAGGTFTMGCTPEQGDDCYDSEKPAHSVTVGDFQISKYEVTQKHWYEIMGSNPTALTEGENLPVDNVRWDDVQVFIQKLNEKTGKKYRLPTEAEWEYAARGGNKSKGYKYSGSNNIDEVAWYDGNSGKTTHPVGSKQPNELGIYDMSGNLWEWVSDYHGNYSSFSATDPQGPSSGSYRVIRGGSWRYDARYCRVSYRIINNPAYRHDVLGFRLVLSS